MEHVSNVPGTLETCSTGLMRRKTCRVAKYLRYGVRQVNARAEGNHDIAAGCGQCDGPFLARIIHVGWDEVAKSLGGTSQTDCSLRNVP